MGVATSDNWKTSALKKQLEVLLRKEGIPEGGRVDIAANVFISGPDALCASVYYPESGRKYNHIFSIEDADIYRIAKALAEYINREEDEDAE